jgi:hypothetical protein
MEYAQAKANMNHYNRWSMKQDGQAEILLWAMYGRVYMHSPPPRLFPSPSFFLQPANHHRPTLLLHLKLLWNSIINSK